MRKTVAVFPGSFDPITLGHEDIIRRVANLYDEVVVLVADSLKKKYFFTKDERLALVRDAVKGLSHVRVDQFRGLTTEYARDQGATVIVRSLRSSGDHGPEMAMAQANKKLVPELETAFFITQPEFAHISSTLVREVASNGGDLSCFVNKNVARAMEEKLSVKTEGEIL